MVPHYIILASVVTLAASFAAGQTPSGARQTPDLNAIVSRMTAAQEQNNAQAKSFTVKRDYQLFDKQLERKAQLVANITYLPSDQKEYQIESSQGGIGERILRDVLEKETEPVKDPARKELSTSNYDFQFMGTENLGGHICYVLGLRPRRDDKELLNGRAWVDAETFNVRKLEGDPAKNPSWWIRDLHILMTFADVDGMWLRTFTHAVANVRFKGQYVMESRDLEYGLGPVVQRRTIRQRRNPGIITGSAFNP